MYHYQDDQDGIQDFENLFPFRRLSQVFSEIPGWNWVNGIGGIIGGTRIEWNAIPFVLFFFFLFLFIFFFF